MPRIGNLNKYGEHAGSAVDAVVIAATPVVDQAAYIEQFGATMEDSGADGVFRLQVSRDNFGADIRTKARITMPVGGTFLKVIKSQSTGPIVVQPGESFRVISKQVVPTEVSAELFGSTTESDIVD